MGMMVGHAAFGGEHHVLGNIGKSELRVPLKRLARAG